MSRLRAVLPLVSVLGVVIGCGGGAAPGSPDASVMADGGPGDDNSAPADRDSAHEDSDSARADGDAPPADRDSGASDGPPPGATIPGLTLQLERSTPEQIGLYLPVTGTVAADARATIRYKRAADPAWRVAHPLHRIRPGEVAAGAPRMPVDSFAGTIFDLVPGTSYDVEITLTEPGKTDQALRTVVTTRSLPAAAPAATVTATPADALQSKLAALKPGDVLELADGTYNSSGLFLAVSGTETQRITIRGKSRAGVVLKSATGLVLQIQVASHVVIENLTLEGSGVDSGTNASSVGVSFWNGGAAQEDVTLRDLDIKGVDQGIVASGTVRGVLVYNASMRGNNVWTMPFIQTNLTWNDDGIRLPGEGNCAWENTLHGFGDSFAVTDGVHSAAVYFYRNRITMTGDDAFEADYSTRNLAFYDNYITNSATFLSLDPLWGGPLFCFRNVSINALRGPFKLNDTNTGFLVYNNTIVRTEGTTMWGWVQFNNGALKSWSFRNNILIYRGGGNLLAIESSGNDPIDFTNNAWFPDKAVWWSSTGGSFASVAAARAGLPATTPLFGTSTSRHEGDVITVSDPFAAPITLGADHLTEVMTTAVPALTPGASPKNAGVEIPNINDSHAGAAPDMGAIIEGRPAVRWGAVRP
jgi:hypothetical protein